MLEVLLASGVRGGPVDSGPGPQELIGGNLGAGFYGEIASADFINGTLLASTMGLTAGTSQYINEPWLKFSLDRKTLFVSRKPLRSYISWDMLNAVNLITGNRAIVINGRTYKVRVFKALSVPYQGANAGGQDELRGLGSEWNRLMYHISGKPFATAGTTLFREGIEEGDWAKYSEAVLMTDWSFGAGTFSICQERHSVYANVIARGGMGVSYTQNRSSNWTDQNGQVGGWRPVLELVE